MFASVLELMNDFRQGRFVILVDNEDRENEGDLMVAADFITAEKITFMLTQARGLICLPMAAEHIQRLQLPLMKSAHHQSAKCSAAFTYSIEASSNITTGISSEDRARTIWVASRPKAESGDVICPGHVFPLQAHPDGVLGRQGHTEGAVDLAQLCGLNPASVLCEIINDDGTMARLADLQKFSQKHGIKIGKISDLVSYRQADARSRL